MGWFNLVKDTASESERFYGEIIYTMMEYFSSIEDSLEASLNRHEESVRERLSAWENMDEATRIANPTFAGMIQDAMDEKETEMKGQFKLIKEAKIGLAEWNRETQGSPIAMRLRELREHFGEDIYVTEIIDMTKLDRLIHELGFEGQGLE
tara:strand:- start:357 stop:809 length:453 start_codon:yes stop_codon:yes gene_type:complete